MAEVYKKTLIHEWNFLGEERTEDERLTDMVGGVKVKLGYNASYLSLFSYVIVSI